MIKAYAAYEAGKRPQPFDHNPSMLNEIASLDRIIFPIS